MIRVAETLPAGAVEGECDDSWSDVLDAFVENFRTRGERGASLCVRVGGETKIDVWGGVHGKDSSPWTRDTVGVVFSATKGATALCAHVLASRGELDLDAPVTRYWPEYGQGGKADTTVAMLLDHTAGVPGFMEPLPAGAFADWSYMVRRIEEEEAWWEPGSHHGYHMLNFGWTVGEVVRRASGQSLGAFFAREVAAPLGLDFWIGLPEAEGHRLAEVEPYIPGKVWPPAADPFVEFIQQDRKAPAARAAANIGGYLGVDRETGEFGPNTRRALAAEIGGAGGVTNARGLAGMYSPLANGGEGLISPDQIWKMSQTASASRRDAILQAPTRFALGFMKAMDNRATLGAEHHSLLMGDRAFGHVGAGGSLGFADPDCGLAFGYTMNRMGPSLLLNPRGQALVDAVYRRLGYRSNAGGVWAR